LTLPAGLVQAFCNALERLDHIRRGDDDTPLVRWGHTDFTVAFILETVAECDDPMPFGVLTRVLSVPGVRGIGDQTYGAGAGAIREVYNSVFRQRRAIKGATAQ
jgi:hypothetical protein